MKLLGENFVNLTDRKKVIVGGTIAMTLSLCSQLWAEPVDEVLVIDGEIEMITKVPSVEGHPIDTIYSGWHYRTPETRAVEADSFANPGMLGVEQGEEIWLS